MIETVTDWFGTWEVQDDGAKRLIEESPEWIAKQNVLNTSPSAPTQEEINDAELEIKILNMLLEVGLI